MTATLRPMSLGGIHDRSLQIYRSKFWEFVSVAAVLALAVQGIMLADASRFQSAISDVTGLSLYFRQMFFAIN
jgi:hypothetical protein